MTAMQVWWALLALSVDGEFGMKLRTTVIVPMKTLGGVAFLETISAMKLAVRPMMAMREQACTIRAIWKVAPSTPYLAMLIV